MAHHDISLQELVIKGQNHYRGNIVSLFESKADSFAHELDIEGILEPEPTNAHDRQRPTSHRSEVRQLIRL